MARKSIDPVNGLRIAKPGYNVNTAPIQHMLFAAGFVAARVWKTDVVTLPHHSAGDALYRSQWVPFGRTFPDPPIVLVAGQLPDGGADISAHVNTIIPSAGTFEVNPVYSISITTTGFTLSVQRRDFFVVDSVAYRAGSAANTWRYWVLENTLT